MARKKDNDETMTAPTKKGNEPPVIDIQPPQVTDRASDFINNETNQNTADPLAVKPGAESVRGTLSPGGEEFDPAIHVYPPSATKGGAWRKRKNTAPRGLETPDDLPNANYRKEAEKAAALYAALHTALLGNDALPGDGELTPLVNAWERYFQTNGLKEVPPGAELFVTHAAYTHSVVTRPAIYPKVKAMTLRLVVRVGKLFGKSWTFNEVKKDGVTQSDSREQRERQNDVSQNLGGSPMSAIPGDSVRSE